MKKKDQSVHFLKRNLRLFQCPVCQNKFNEVKKYQLICQNNHSFDISKKGTIHFLMHKANNQYNRDTLSSRMMIAQTGFWRPLLAEVIKHITHLDGNLLDVGCGEGSHLHVLTELGLKGGKIGFDISKEGIQLAAAQYSDAFWCVADLADSSFGESQFNTLLNIFSPSNYSEFNRLLKDGGQCIKIVPNKGYLKELRSMLYKDSKEYSNKNVIENFIYHFPKSKQIPVTYQKRIEKSHMSNFLTMTPLSWGAERDTIANILDNDYLDMTVDATLLIGEKE